MSQYAKPWLSIDEQVDKLAGRGLGFGSRDVLKDLLAQVGYYRLSGYLYPLRETGSDSSGAVSVLERYREGATAEYAVRLIDYDRRLRMLVLDGVERIEVSLRTTIGHTLGRRSAFAHLDRASFTEAFVDDRSTKSEHSR